MKKKKYLEFFIKQISLIIILLSISFPQFVYAQNNENNENSVCTVYFTGVGCPHCAKTDTNVLLNYPTEYNFFVIEYEIYQSNINAPLLYSYNENFDTDLGVPLLIFSKDFYIAGDNKINGEVRGEIEKMGSNPCQLLEKQVDFNELDITNLPGEPKIWGKERVLLYDGGEGNSNEIIELLKSKNIEESLKDIDYTELEPETVALSGYNINFDKAVKIGGWIFQYLEDDNIIAAEDSTDSGNNIKSTEEKAENEEKVNENPQDLTVAKILSLAAVDAINPCALAVLTLMLIAIITYNPREKKNIILAGLAFTLSVFLIYIFYGLVLIKFFQLIQVLTEVRIILYMILGSAAILLGLLNIKDYLFYKPGCAGTEMPMSWRPKVQKIISGITSPKGAFVVGAFVTVFLLPCTIGPYIIASGILSFLSVLKTLPWLILYNLIFVLPMLFITILVYLGLTKVENVSGWKDKNIRKLHLVSGIIILLLGIAMLAGWV